MLKKVKILSILANNIDLFRDLNFIIVNYNLILAQFLFFINIYN